MPLSISWLFIIVGIISIILPNLPAAYGHAIPSTYSIEPNSILEKGSTPSELVISFSERPDPKISHIHLVNSQNERIDNDDFTISASNPRQGAVTLDKTKLGEDGVYTVSWLAMSLDDGHIAQGSYVFGVGNVNPTGNAGGDNQQTEAQAITYVTSTVDALLRWPLIVSQAAIVGGVISYFVLQRGDFFSSSRNYKPISFDLKLSAKKRFMLILIAGALVISISSTALVFLQASNLLDRGSGSVSDELLSTVQSLIFDTPAGVVWSIRITTSIAIGGLALLYFVREKRTDFLKKDEASFSTSSAILLTILAAGAASIFSNSMLSHNSAVTFFPSVAVFADWVHFMAVSAWVGGLFYFCVVLLFSIKSEKEVERRAYYLSVMLPRFSLIATASLGIIGVTGVYMAWIHLPTFDSLFVTQYGNNLIIKLSTALPMVLLGAYHQVKLHKNIVLLATIGKTKKEDSSTSQNTNNNTANNSVSKFGRTVKIESLIGIAVLFAASLLTITSPPSQMQHQLEQSGTTPGMEMQETVTPGYSQGVTISDINVTFEITPFHPGFNTFTVALTDKAGSPAQDINAVYLRFTNPEARIGPIVATLNNTQNSSGNYSAVGGYLSQTGNWTIDLIVQRIGAYDLNHSFDVSLGTTSSHDSMNMRSINENMQMQQHETGNSIGNTTAANTVTQESESHPPQSPAFDSFAWLAIGLSIAVGVGSVYYFKKSKKQLEGTLETLGGEIGQP